MKQVKKKSIFNFINADEHFENVFEILLVSFFIKYLKHDIFHLSRHLKSFTRVLHGTAYLIN